MNPRAWILALGLLIAAPPVVLAQDESSIPNFRRVWVDPERLPAELKRSTDWVNVSRPTFEATLAQAERHREESQRTPWLVSTSYEARCDQETLEGTATWELFSPRGPRSLLRLEPWNLILRGPPVGGSGAALAAGSPPLVIIEGVGRQSIKVPWVQRGETKPDGVWFYLQIPPAPQVQLVIDTPPGTQLDWPAARGQVTCRGKDGTGRPTWLVEAGGKMRPDLALVVRTTSAAQRRTLARVATEYRELPSGLAWRTTLELENADGVFAPAQLALDARLQISNIVRLPTRRRWTGWSVVDTPAGRVLRLDGVQQREPRLVLEIHGHVEVGQGLDQTQHLAGLKVPKEWLADETMSVMVPRDCRWQAADLGDFRLVDVPSPAPGDSQYWVWRFEPARVGPVGTLRRPTLQWTPDRPDAQTTQRWWCQIQEPLARATWHATVTTRRTTLPDSLAWRLPPGWRLIALDTQPVGGLRSWHIEANRDEATLHVYPRESWSAHREVRLFAQLEATNKVDFTASRRLAVPRMVPRFGRLAEEWLAYSLPRLPNGVPMLEATLDGAGWFPVSEATGDMGMSKMGDGVADGRFLALDRDGVATLRVSPLPPQVNAEVQVKVGATNSRTRFHLKIEPWRGRVTSLPLQFTAGLGPISWSMDQRDPPTWTALGSAHGELRWARPLVAGQTLTAECPESAVVPLPLPGAARWSGTVEWAAPADARRLQGKGLWELRATRSDPVSSARYDATTHDVRWHQDATNLPPPWLSDVVMTTIVQSTGACRHHYEATVHVHTAQTARLTVPDPGVNLAAELDGHALASRPGTSAMIDLLPGRHRLRVRWEGGTVGILGPDPGVAWPLWHTPTVEVERRRRWVFPATGWVFVPANGRWIHKSSPQVQVGHGDATGEERVWEQSVVDPATAIPGWIPPAGRVLTQLGVLVLSAMALVRLQRRRALLALLLGLASAMVVWLGTGMSCDLAIAVLAGVALAYLLRPRPTPDVIRGAPGSSSAATVIIRGSAVVLALVTLGLPLAPVVARTPREPAIVFVVSGTPETVFVPTELWRRVERLAKEPLPGMPDVVILSGSYRGTVRDDVAEMEADWRVRVFRGGPVNLPIILGEGRLRQVWLDDLPTVPITASPDEPLTFSVNGIGEHRLRLTWDQPVASTGGTRSLRWRLPNTPAATLTLAFPFSPRNLQADAGLGMLTLQPTGSETIAQVALGMSGLGGLRWDVDQPQGPKGDIVEVHRLETGLQRILLQSLYQVERLTGSIKDLHWQVPDRWQVQDVELLTPGPNDTNRLEAWTLDSELGWSKLLRVRLRDPIKEGSQVLVSLVSDVPAASPALVPVLGGSLPMVSAHGIIQGLVAHAGPRAPPGVEVALPLPKLKNLPSTGGWIGWVGRGVTGPNWKSPRGLSEQRNDAWGKLWPQPLGSPQVETLHRWRGTDAPTLVMRLAGEQSIVQTQSKHRVRASPMRTDWVADVEFQASKRPLLLLQARISPEWQLRSVTGPDVLDWHVHGSSLFVWFRRPVADHTRLTLESAWLVPPQGEPHLGRPWPSLVWADVKADEPEWTLELSPEMSLRPNRPPPSWREVAPRPGVRHEVGGRRFEVVPPDPDDRLSVVAIPQPRHARVRQSQTTAASGVNLRFEVTDFQPAAVHEAALLLHDVPAAAIVEPQAVPRDAIVQVRAHGEGLWEWRWRSPFPITRVGLSVSLPPGLKPPRIEAVGIQSLVDPAAP